MRKASQLATLSPHWIPAQGRDDDSFGLKAVPFMTEGLFIDHFQILKKICAISHICEA
jgi:hypothetical protein